MSQLLFPDNTVLCNFATVRRLDLLRDWLRGRGRWTQAVAHEASQSENFLPTLRNVRVEGWLGEPLEVTDARVELIRRSVFGGTLAQPLKHLGEAETCTLILNHDAYRESWWLSDDTDAVEYARRQHIVTYETIDIFRAVIADGDITCGHAYDLMQLMHERDRELTLPASPRDLQ